MTSDRRLAILDLCSLFAPRDRTLVDEIDLALRDPSAYARRFAAQLAERGLKRPPPNLPWIALVDGLRRRGRLAEIDWKSDAAEIARAVGRLAKGRLPRDARRWDWATSDRWADAPTERALRATGACVAAHELVLVSLDFGGDSHPVALLRAEDVPGARRTARRTGLGTIVAWKGKLPASPRPAQPRRLPRASRSAVPGPPPPPAPRRFRDLAEAVAAPDEVEWLDLAESGLDALPPEIGRLRRLRQLDLRLCKLSALPRELGGLLDLESLNLWKNSLSELPDEIGSLARLRVLRLHGNRLTALPSSFWRLGSIRELDLGDNRLGRIPGEVGGLRSLRLLFLSRNGLDEIPPEVGALQHLEVLDVSGNTLNDLPASLARLSALRTLDLRDCGLARLPGFLVELPALRSVALMGNPLAAAQAAELDRLRPDVMWLGARSGPSD